MAECAEQNSVLNGTEKEGAEAGVGRMLGALDEIERRIEKFRDTAFQLEQEKEDLLGALQMVQDNKELLTLNQCDREELQVNAERLVCRCLTVDVRVSTPRSNSQEEALQATNTFLDGIREQLATNLHEASETLKGLINACSSDQTVQGPVNHKFQALVLACAAEDQKKIRKKLHKWMSSIHAAAKGLS